MQMQVKGKRLVEEFSAKLAARQIKGTYDLVMLGVKTQQGGIVAMARTGREISCNSIVFSGDVMRDQDGSKSKVVPDTAAYSGQPTAIVGSTADNGQIMFCSLQSSSQIRENYGDEGAHGLLQPDYLACGGGSA